MDRYQLRGVPAGAMLMTSRTNRAIPGVVVAVPLAERGVPAVRRVMAPQGVSTMVGHCVQVVRDAVWRTRKDTSGQRPPVPIRRLPVALAHSPPPPVANSRSSRSLRGKLTYVESLLVRTLESEKRLRSEGEENESRKHGVGRDR